MVGVERRERHRSVDRTDWPFTFAGDAQALVAELGACPVRVASQAVDHVGMFGVHVYGLTDVVSEVVELVNRFARPRNVQLPALGPHSFEVTAAVVEERVVGRGVGLAEEDRENVPTIDRAVEWL